MLTPRSVISIVVTVALLSLIWAVVSLSKPMDRDGMAADSFGTRAHGFRALYETLERLDFPTQRILAPPSQVEKEDGTLVIWSPDQTLVRAEPVYLQQLGDWVREGGKVILAPEAGRVVFRKGSGETLLLKDTTAAEELGLKSVTTELVTLNGPSASRRGRARFGRTDDDEIDFEDLRDSFMPREVPTADVSVDAEGSLAPIAAGIASLVVPQEVQVLDVEESEPKGTISITQADGKKHVVAAQYDVGKGQVIVVSDPAIFENRLLARADNSVLAVRLLAAGGTPIFWDEFYHGLTIRGNPLYLLTHGAYALLAVVLLTAIGVWVWRKAVHLGPPRASTLVSRRMVGEYIDAMASLFRRSSEGNRFMLEEVRRGVLWKIRHRFHVRGDGEDPEIVAAAMARRDPAAARKLRTAVADADAALSAKKRLPDRQILQLVKGLTDCL